MDLSNYKDGVYAVYVLRIGKDGYYVGMSQELNKRLKTHIWELKNNRKYKTWYKHYKCDEDFQVVKVVYFDTKYECKRFENKRIKEAKEAEKSKGFELLNYQKSNKLSEMSPKQRQFIIDYYAKKENKQK